MPVLELETPCFPGDLLRGAVDESPGTDSPVTESTVTESTGIGAVGDDLPRTERRWWGVYTRSRQEKSLARDLLARRIPYYLPLVPQTLVYRRSRVVSHLPLFSGYVFLFGTEDERVGCLQTNRVSRMIEVPDQARLVRELRHLQLAIGSGERLSIESRLEPGDRVRVCHGPLVGLEGVIVRRQRPTRLLVAVDLLRQGISLEIDDCLVRPV